MGVEEESLSLNLSNLTLNRNSEGNQESRKAIGDLGFTERARKMRERAAAREIRVRVYRDLQRVEMERMRRGGRVEVKK